MRSSTACFFLLDQNSGLVEGVLQTVPNWQQSHQSPGSAHVWPKGGASICSTDPRSAGGSPINHWSLTTLIEEGPGLTRHTLKAAMVETYDHSLVAFRTVPGTHRRRHLQEAMVFCSHVEMLISRDPHTWDGKRGLWASALTVHSQSRAPGHVNQQQLGICLSEPWEPPWQGWGEPYSLIPGIQPRVLCELCQHCPQASGCPSGSHVASDHVPVTWLAFPCHRILVVFMSSDTENGEEEPMTLKVHLGPLQSQAIMS